MKIFIIRIKDFLKSIDTDSFEKIYSSEKRNLEFQLGRFLTKYVASHVYGLSDLTIDVENGRPYFLNSDLNFSISHSNDIIGVAFSEGTIGLDIEKYKDRNLKRLSDYFKRPFNTLEEFYQYWTLYEANYKSKLSDGVQKTFKFEDYFLSISVDCDADVKMYELLCPAEIINLKKIKDVSLVINELKIDLV